MDYAQRRKEQGERTVEAILQAALELSREKSFDRVSVREICKAAGITTGAFYHHFKSKEELLLQGFAPLDSYMRRSMAAHMDESPARRLGSILSIYADFIETQGWELVSRYYQRRLASSDVPPMDPTRYTHRAMLECLCQAKQAGQLCTEHTPEWLADFFFRHFRGMVIDWVIHRGGYPLWPKLEQDYYLFQKIFQAPPGGAGTDGGDRQE